jgi:cation diffusion facilitator CzcD-associated flavoprotein CzcO
MADQPPGHVDVLVVGAGFAGVYAVHRATEAGLSVHCFEAGADVGGTWYWNRYPGARCDVESFDYSYSFSEEIQQEWRWTERYATQPEIWAYLRFVADRLGTRARTTFGTRVVRAHLDEARGLWTVGTDAGHEVTCRHVLWATGPLSVPLLPDLPGRESFTGRVLHSGAWPHEPVDFSGRRVACVGTGSSGIQMIPRLAEQAEHLYVLQRTPNFSVPARNHRHSDEQVDAALAGYPERRRLSWSSPAGTPYPSAVTKTFDVEDDERQAIFERAWAVGGARFSKTFADQLVDVRANAEAVTFVHDQIARAVRDPDVAAALMPRDHAIGARRICVDTGYYETFNRDNVTLVDLRREPLVRVVPHGVAVGEREIAVDDLVLATGFDAMTGALQAIDIAGRGGHRLAEAWADGPVSYLGLAVHGFPDMWVLNGPGSPSVFSNLVLTSEQQVDWVLGLVRAAGDRVVEAIPEAQAEWVEKVAAIGAATLAGQTSSWYLGANVPGKPRFFLPYAGGFSTYKEACDTVAEHGYDGFVMTDS